MFMYTGKILSDTPWGDLREGLLRSRHSVLERRFVWILGAANAPDWKSVKRHLELLKNYFYFIKPTAMNRGGRTVIMPFIVFAHVAHAERLALKRSI